jgi:hypothetical protein
MSMWLFGSASNFSRGGFDYVGRLEDLQRRLSAILGCKVDVIEEPVRKARLQAEIDRDRSLAFQPGPLPSSGHHRQGASDFRLHGRHGFGRLRERPQDLLRHEYDAIREDRLFEIVKIDLPRSARCVSLAWYLARKSAL